MIDIAPGIRTEMSRTDYTASIYDRLIDLLAIQFRYTTSYPYDFQPDTNLVNQLGFDEDDLQELSLAVADEFNIDLQDIHFEEMEKPTISSLTHFIASYCD